MVALVMLCQAAQEPIERVKAAFDLFDVDGDGLLNEHQNEAMLRALMAPPRDPQVLSDQAADVLLVIEEWHGGSSGVKRRSWRRQRLLDSTEIELTGCISWS